MSKRKIKKQNFQKHSYTQKPSILLKGNLPQQSYKDVLNLQKGVYELRDELFRDYAKQLADNGLIESRASLKKNFDYIDITKILDQAVTKGNREQLYINTKEIREDEEFLGNNIYNIFPPFNDGVIRVNYDRYIHWSLLKVNDEWLDSSEILSTSMRFMDSMKRSITNNSITNTLAVADNLAKEVFTKHFMMLLVDYSCSENKIWFINQALLFVGGLSKDKEGKFFDNSLVDCFGISLQTTEDLMENEFLLNSIGWNNKRREIFKAFLKEFDPICDDETSFKDAQLVAKCFMTAILHVNKLLSQNKPKASRKSSQSKIKVLIDKEAPQPKERVLRLLDDKVEFRSIKVPHASTEERVIKYTLARWKKRGHLRHYKSGKVSYVKETICH